MLNEISGNEPQTYSVLENNADGIELPDGVDLQSANFVRDGSDLLIQSADEGNFTVNNYFSNETLADIVSGDGHIMSGNAFDTLSDAAAHNQVAQAQIPGLEVATSNEPGTQVRGEPIGSVDNAEGVVSVTHVDGTTETLNVGDKVYQGDVLVTESGAGVGITLADTSVFSLGEEGELVLDELVYDPGQMEGSAVLSLLQGTATYVSGQIAKINPDAVQITTPVATIGIRGTKVFVEYNDGNFRTINMLETTENGEVPGEIVVYDINGTPLGSTNQANIGWSWNSNDNTPPNARQFSSHDVDTITRENLRHLPKSIIEKSIENQDNQQASLGQAHKEDGAQQDHGYKDTVVDVNDGHDIDYQDIIVQNVHSTTITSITPIIVDDENIPIKETETETETEIKLTVPKDDTTSTLHGTAIDGYLNGSTVFVDLNKDGVLDDNESNRTTTDSNGKFNLTIPTDQTDYIISVVGGEDMATNAEFYGSLQTVAGATVITPLTTLLANGVSKAQLVSIFGIDANIDITQNDPIALSKSGDNVAAYSRIAAVGVQIQNTIIQAASIFEGAAIGGVDDGFAANKLFNAIASAIKESNFDITNTDNLETIITNAAAEIPGVDTSKVASSAATAAQLISTSNTSIKAQIDAGLTGDALLNFVTQEQVSATSLAEKMTTTISNGQTLNNALISTDEDTTKTITLTLNEGQSVSIETQPAHGNVIVNENGSITYTPGENYNGDDSFTYTITSGEEVIKTVPVNIQVKAVNDAPVTSSSPVIAGTEDTALLITKAQLLAKTTDPEGDTITLSDVSAASGTLVDNGDDTWTYTPVANATGNVTINFTVSDGTDTANATATLNIAADDDAPTVSGPITLNAGTEDTTFYIAKEDLLANAHDIDSASLYVIANSLTASSGSLSAVYDDHFSLTGWNFTPAQDSTETVTFSYNIGDGTSTVTTSATAIINAVDDTPVVSAPVTLNAGTEDASFVVTKTQLLANADDVDSDTLTIGNLTASSGTLTPLKDGTGWTFTPTPNSTETVTFSYSISDGNTSVSTTATATITAVNDAPTVSAPVILDAETQDTSFFVSTAQLLANASDIEGDNLAVVVDSLTLSSGTFTAQHDDNFKLTGWNITPAQNSTETITFSYNITDGNDTVATTATVQINDLDNSLSNDTATLTEDGSATISVLANDTIRDGATLSVGAASHGSVIVNDDNTLTYTATRDYSGTDSFSYIVTDDDGETQTAIVNLTINADADAPNLGLSLGAGSAIEVAGGETTKVTINNDEVTTTGKGYTVTAILKQGDTPSVENVAIQNNANVGPIGFGVSGARSGDISEIGNNGQFQESLFVDFDNNVSSVDVQFAWLAGQTQSHSAETAAYEFFLNGVSVGSGTFDGITDQVENAVSLSPNSGSVFDQIVFTAPSTDDDYLIHSLSFDTPSSTSSYVDIPVYLTASEADSDGSETLSTITLSGIPDGATLYVDDQAVSVSDHSASLANDNLDNVKIRVSADQDNFDLSASITSTDGNDTETTTQSVNVPDYTFNSDGNDVIAIQSGDVTINGGSGNDTLQFEAGFDPNFTTDHLTLTSIEKFDFLTDETANSLTIGATNITSMNSDNSLIIQGNLSDSVTFSDGQDSWTQGATDDQGYTTYDHNTSDASVHISSTVAVTGF